MTRRRATAARPSSDAAFADDAEFRLFVEATAGLGPELTYHTHSRTTSGDMDLSTHRNSIHVARLSPGPGQMAAATRAADRTRASPRASPRLDAGSWASRRLAFLSIGIDDDDHGNYDDDELPNYAESQAQAQAHQRVEATRRAQELQRRWQESRAADRRL